MTDISEAELPDVLTAYLVAHDGRNSDAASTLFATEASVTDAGATHASLDEIRTWLDHEASEYTYTTTTTRCQRLDDDRYVVTRHLEGNFPGGVVDLRFTFDLADGKITSLVIAP